MFGERVKELRKSKGLSQEELGEQFSISGPAVSKWESGLSEPDNLTLIKLSDFFGVSVDYLLGKSDLVAENEKETLKKMLQKTGFMTDDDDLTDEELERLIKFVNANKEFLKKDNNEK